MKHETWGAFFEYAATFDIKTCEMPNFQAPDGSVGGLRYLRRVIGNKVLTYPLPQDCTPDRTLRYWICERVCERLEIPMPKWTITL